MSKQAIPIILLLALFGCKQEKCMSYYDKCTDGHYEQYETGGQSTSTAKGSSNRVETIYVCDNSEIDSAETVCWVLDF